MKMVNIMDYRVYIYALMLFATTFAFSGININSIFRKGHVIEARIFLMLLIASVSYLASRFIISFIECF